MVMEVPPASAAYPTSFDMFALPRRLARLVEPAPSPCGLSPCLQVFCMVVAGSPTSRPLLDMGTVSFLDPPVGIPCTFVDVRTVREETWPESGPTLFLSTCTGSPEARVSAAFLSRRHQAAMAALEAEAAAAKKRVVVVVVHTSRDDRIQEELDSWKQGQLDAGKWAVDIMVLSGEALARYMPALAARPYLLQPSTP